MPRPAKGARLWLRRDDQARGGAAWIIKDGGRQYRTGCAADESEEAERRLADHIAAKYAPARRERALAEIPLADVLKIYLDDVVPDQANPEKVKDRLGRLEAFWGDKTLDEVTGQTCRAYVDFRVKADRTRRAALVAKREKKAEQTSIAVSRDASGGAKRDLEDLRAAINHHAREGLHRGSVRVALPKRGKPRQRWLTRDEAAKLLWVCWRHREHQEGAGTKKRPLRHLVRFLLIGLYTGSRPGAILTAAWDQGPGRSWVDVDRGLFYRLADGKVETAKRQPPVPLAPRLLAHMRRWREDDHDRGTVVRFAGAPVASVKTAITTASRLSELPPGVSGYTLRHTAATWLMQADISIWMAARFLGTSPEVIERNYAHHSPSYLGAAAAAITGGTRTKSAPIDANAKRTKAS